MVSRIIELTNVNEISQVRDRKLLALRDIFIYVITASLVIKQMKLYVQMLRAASQSIVCLDITKLRNKVLYVNASKIQAASPLVIALIIKKVISF